MHASENTMASTPSKRRLFFSLNNQALVNEIKNLKTLSTVAASLEEAESRLSSCSCDCEAGIISGGGRRLRHRKMRREAKREVEAPLLCLADVVVGALLCLADVGGRRLVGVRGLLGGWWLLLPGLLLVIIAAGSVRRSPCSSLLRHAAGRVVVAADASWPFFWRRWRRGGRGGDVPDVVGGGRGVGGLVVGDLADDGLALEHGLDGGLARVPVARPEQADGAVDGVGHAAARLVEEGAEDGRPEALRRGVDEVEQPRAAVELGQEHGGVGLRVGGLDPIEAAADGAGVGAGLAKNAATVAAKPPHDPSSRSMRCYCTLLHSLL
jgi:hypothetical protein